MSLAQGIAISGDELFVVDNGTDPGSGTIGEYTLSGMPVNAALISGLDSPNQIVVSGDDLFVTSILGGTIGKYTTSGETVNASLISGVGREARIAVVPASVPDASSTWTLLLLGLTATFGLKPLLRRPA